MVQFDYFDKKIFLILKYAEYSGAECGTKCINNIIRLLCWIQSSNRAWRFAQYQVCNTIISSVWESLLGLHKRHNGVSDYLLCH
jgi:hypothetical protein